MFNKCPYHYYLSVAVSGAQSWIPVMYTNLSPCIPYIHSPTYSRAHLNSRTGLWGHLWNSPELLFQAHLKMDVFLSKLTGRVYKDGHILRVKRTCLLLSRYKKQCLIFVFFSRGFSNIWSNELFQAPFLSGPFVSHKWLLLFTASSWVKLFLSSWSNVHSSSLLSSAYSNTQTY